MADLHELMGLANDPKVQKALQGLLALPGRMSTRDPKDLIKVLVANGLPTPKVVVLVELLGIDQKSGSKTKVRAFLGKTEASRQRTRNAEIRFKAPGFRERSKDLKRQIAEVSEAMKPRARQGQWHPAASKDEGDKLLPDPPPPPIKRRKPSFADPEGRG